MDQSCGTMHIQRSLFGMKFGFTIENDPLSLDEFEKEDRYKGYFAIKEVTDQKYHNPRHVTAELVFHQEQDKKGKPRPHFAKRKADANEILSKTPSQHTLGTWKEISQNQHQGKKPL